MKGEIRNNYKFSIKLHASQNSYSFILLNIDIISLVSLHY